jgi:hypothetical protein
MKTSNMDYEKKYKEALEKIRSLHRDYNQISTLIDVKEELENIFPELAESEDERKRKALMQNLKERFGTKGNMGEGLDMPKVLAWLEKQGEQKQVVIPKFRVGDIIRWKKAGSIEYTIKKICDKGYINTADGIMNISQTDIEFELVEQKSAEWSEEDEKQARQIERIVSNDGCTQKLQKQIADWFKSLKDRIQPQSQWKPSEEQLIALRVAIGDEQGSDCCDTLRSLLKDLKSL